MKKEIIISSYDSLKNPYYSGGGASAIHSVAKRIIDTYRVTILTASFKGSKNYTLDGVHYQYIGLPFLGPQAGQLLFQFILPFYVLTKKFDCWIESLTPPFSTAFLQLFTKNPVIGLVHMLSGEDMERKYKLPFRLVESVGLKTYKNFIVLTSNAKKQILKINKKANILVTTNGIDLPENLEPYIKRDKSYLLFIGRIEVNQKGLDKLLLAYKEISKIYSLDLKIAGTGSVGELIKLKKLIKDNYIEDKVKLLGRVDGPEKMKLISNAAIIVIPSRFETFSITALEAIAYGVPLVCFDIKGLRWIPNNLVYKAKPFSENSLQNKINFLLNNSKLRDDISQNQISESKKYSWEDVAKKYGQFIQNLT